MVDSTIFLIVMIQGTSAKTERCSEISELCRASGHLVLDLGGQGSQRVYDVPLSTVQDPTKRVSPQLIYGRLKKNPRWSHQ